MTPPARSFAALPAAGRIAVGLVALLTAAFCVYLWPEWRNNPDLSHGLFAPVLFVLLLNEARKLPGLRLPESEAAGRWLRGVFLTAAVALTALAGLYAAAIDWTHPLVSFALAGALSALTFGALLWLASARVRALPFNWSAIVAAGLWPLCAPLPPGTYARLTLELQFQVTEIVVRALHLLGVAASTQGNVIVLAHTTVGVEEACSGVRSLLSCVVAAFFFSATLVRKPWARVLILAIAPALAFGMNIVRSLVLTLLANGGVDIGGAWHDWTGFAVLGVTAAILGALALKLGGAGADDAMENVAVDGATTTPGSAARVSKPWGLLAAGAATTAAIGFFVLNTHGPARPESTPPDMNALLPVSPAGWDLVHTEDLYQFASVLETEDLVQRTYVRRTATGEPVQLTVYVAHWPAGKVPVSLVASHTPEACWPGGGWVAQPAPRVATPFLAGPRTLPAPEHRTFTYAGHLQNVWYWHLYDGRSITQADPRSAGELLRLAWNYGFRTGGEQWFVRISSNRPWEEIGGEPLLADILARLQPHGLRAPDSAETRTVFRWPAASP